LVISADCHKKFANKPKGPTYLLSCDSAIIPLKMTSNLFKKSLVYLCCKEELPYKLIRRYMKSMSNNALTILKHSSRQERLVSHLQEFISIHFDNPLKSSTDLLDCTSKYILNPTLGENLIKQTIAKGFFPRASFRKESMVSALKNADTNALSEKVMIINPEEKSDARFLVETVTASRFCETSFTIKKVAMNSEKPSAFKISGSSNKYPDIDIQLDNIFFSRDIKSGNRMEDTLGSILAEIPYSEDGTVYAIRNKQISLEQIQERRLIELHNNHQYGKLYPTVAAINNLPGVDICFKNIQIQEEIFKFILANPICNRLSFYYYKDIETYTQLNVNFYKRVTPLLNDQIFNNKKDFQRFLSKTVEIYNEEVSDILSNIKKSKPFWIGSGLENIADDIFTS
jgi:hypothetical protein